MRDNRALRLYGLVYLGFLYVPVLMLPLFSFSSSAEVAFPLGAFTLHWYSQMLTDPDLGAALLASLRVALVASIVSSAAGTLTAYALTRRRGLLTRPTAVLAVLPLFIPGVILGVALLIAVNLIGIGPSLTAVAIGHIAICLPLTIIIMRGRFIALPVSLDEAAMDLGASAFTAFRRVALPVVLPGFLSCLILTFTTSIALRRHILPAVAMLAIAPAAAQAESKITYYTWDGYDPAMFHQAYLKEHPEGLNISVFGDDDEALAKVKAGYHPDIAHPCVDKLPQWREAGLLQPIDTSRIPNWTKIYPVFRNMPGVQADGKVWMVPWDWGNTSIIYRTDLVKNPEQSWGLLWDKRYAGKIADIDATHDTWVAAALLAGVDPFSDNPVVMKKVEAKLREQRPLVRTYTNDLTSVEQALASGELVAAMAWNANYVDLVNEHVPVAFMHPKEKMITWACGMVILKNAKNLDEVYDFINARLQDDAGEALVTSYSYGTSNAEAYEKVPDSVKQKFALPEDPSTELANTLFTSAFQNPKAVAKAFARIKEGG